VPPVVTAPPAVTIEATGVATPVTLGAATVTDNVDTGLVATASPNGPFPVGTTTVTWSATDAAGNTGTATQLVTVTDTTPPVIAPPADVTATSPDNQPVAVNIGQATATDIFAVTISNDAPATFPVGTTTVTWTATDANGNSATATQLVTVSAPVATEAVYWHHNDHLGTPQAMTDVNGTVVWTMSQTPFGIATVNEDPDGDGIRVTNNFRFPGQYFDAETGLNYNYQRTYDPALGRYTQHDPIGLNGGMNPFGYVGGNPVNATDPSGLKVLVGQHPAFANQRWNPFNHVAIILRPDNPNDFINHPFFSHSCGKEATLGGQAFGSGLGLFGKLKKVANYSGDLPSKLNNLTIVAGSSGQGDTMFIKRILAVFSIKMIGCMTLFLTHGGLPITIIVLYRMC